MFVARFVELVTRQNRAFELHNNCLPGSTVVTGSRVEKFFFSTSRPSSRLPSLFVKSIRARIALPPFYFNLPKRMSSKFFDPLFRVVAGHSESV